MTLWLNQTSLFQPLLNPNETSTETATSQDTVQHWTRLFALYYIPFIIISGVVGNTLSFVFFVRAPLSRHSCNVYLAAICLANTGVLLRLTFQWLCVVAFKMDDIWGSCQLVWFLGHGCAFLSVWYIVAFATDAYIRICRPSARSIFCSVLRAKIVVTSFAAVAIVVYVNLSLTRGMRTLRDRHWCATLPRFHSVMPVLTILHLAINTVLPITLIGVFIVLVGVNAARHRPIDADCDRQPVTAAKESFHGFVLAFLTVCVLGRLPSAAMPLYELTRHMLNMRTSRANHILLKKVLDHLDELSFGFQVIVYLCMYKAFIGVLKKGVARTIKRYQRYGYQRGNSSDCIDNTVNLATESRVPTNTSV